MDHTEGTLLGGRVRYLQPATGYRTGIEPVLLAASVPARPGQRVVEAGCGAGAGLLCLSARVPGVIALGVELDPALAALARRNIGAEIVCADMLAGVPPAAHAFANPPWHDAAGTPSADPARARAKVAVPTLLADWIAAMAAAVPRRGTVSVLVPAAQFGRAAAAARAAGLSALVLIPLWPRAGVAAKLVILRGIRGARGPDRVAAGLVLHEADGQFTPAAQAVLREGAALGT